jgi:foldase protein PrsA
MDARSWKIGLVALCLCGAARPPRAFAQAEKTADDAPIARLGTEKITRKALTTQLVKYYGTAGVEQMIDRSLIRQEAARLKVSVTDADLDARIGELKGAAAGRFQEALDAEGITEETWRERVRSTLLAEKVLAKKWPVKDDDLTRLTVRYIRVQARQEAISVIRDAKTTNFEQLVLQRSQDKETLGLVQPEKFLRVDNPYFFKITDEAGLRVGQVTPKPIDSSGFWLILKLEARLAPETLTGAQRDAAVKRIQVYRMGRLLPTLRTQYKPEKKVTGLPLFEDQKYNDETVALQAGKESITRKALYAYLLENFGKAALEQLVERSIVSQEAARLGVSVTDAQLTARLTEMQKVTKPSILQVALTAEGITEEAWRERVRYSYLAEKVAGAKSPVMDPDLVRLAVRYIRVAKQEDALAVIQAAQSGMDWDQLRQRSLDRAGDGYLQPKAMLQIDNPMVFKMLTDARLSPGQPLPRPIQTGDTWVVLRLEARLEPETMKPAERAEAVRRINASRMDEVLNAARKGYKVEYLVPVKTLLAEARS